MKTTKLVLLEIVAVTVRISMGREAGVFFKFTDQLQFILNYYIYIYMYIYM